MGILRNLGWVLAAATLGIVPVWALWDIGNDVYMASDFVVTNATMNAKRACVEKSSAEACSYAEAPGYSRLKKLCTRTLDVVIFTSVCPIELIEGRDLEVDRAFLIRKRS